MVASYHQLSRGVDGVNQMALQMRQMGRQMTWSHAVHAFVLRYAVVNAYATCRSLGGAQTGTTFDWQWDLIRRRFCKVAVAKPIHVPMRMLGRRGMRCSRAWCGTPPILGVVHMVGTRNFTCYMGAL